MNESSDRTDGFLEKFIQFRLGYDLLIAIAMAVIIGTYLKEENWNEFILLILLSIGIGAVVVGSQVYLKLKRELKILLNILGYILIFSAPVVFYYVFTK